MRSFDDHTALLRIIRRRRMTTGMDWTRLADMCDLVDQAGSRPSRFFRRILPGFHAAGDCWQDLHQYRDHQGDH